MSTPDFFRSRLGAMVDPRYPQRWAGAIRDWSRVDVVTLNPDRDTVAPAQDLRHESKRIAV